MGRFLCVFLACFLALAPLHGQAIINGGGGGGSVANLTSFGTYASLPACGSSEQIYFFTSGVYTHAFCDGASAWHYFAFGVEVTPPSGLSTWRNQGSAAVDATDGFVYLSGPASATSAFRIREMNTPATPFTITLGFLVSALGGDNNGTGLMVVQSSDDKTIFFHAQDNQATANAGSLELFVINKYTSISTYSATDYIVNQPQAAGSPLWLRYADNGTNRTWSFSTNGRSFITAHTETRTTFLTADKIGVAIDNQSDNKCCPHGTFFHWKVE